ncbi:hypothetical protein V496_01342 [Pseudogymnoascus sp. VKM F-4515 (FW-2607)]|nr:hypothetical protein V496_01342 [Pseudogymnoascus sp. VKM F-4515 (FW-2607)]
MAPMVGVSGETRHISGPGWEEAEEVAIGEGRPQVLIGAVEAVEDGQYSPWVGGIVGTRQGVLQKARGRRQGHHEQAEPRRRHYRDGLWEERVVHVACDSST